MVIRSASLETVCGITSDLPRNQLPEVAFSGRSNVGKSSLINTVLGRKSLARTSSVPGKTQTLNFYNINNELYLVDLPGYGYTEAAKSVNEKWGKMIERYLRESEMLSAIFLLVDMRHAPTKLDIAMAETVRFLEYQLIVLATKADKLKTNERKKNIALIEKTLSMGEDDILIPFSSVTKEGKEDVLDLLSQVSEGFSKEKEG
ncbi:MAG: YihA family ribosome biogenesis GTP-binding protein [Lachnospiraceae bacterium]|nr:YihA family ribosome biogenesis GTP-binding protein [Lachnospiraceae bacterium]MBQ6259189.1 YihA family ribosome biogenesis GTP-binding protein [Lachnospiraceae bacterium]